MDFNSFREKYEKVPVIEYPNRVSKTPLVSICVQTYQHVNYIRQCLDGILMQKTNFDYEILLGEDDSEDGTREICIEYAEKYPQKIRLFLHYRDNNIKINGYPTGRFNFLYNLYSARGKYVAICEGDDYWIDSYKLQDQIKILENDSCFVGVFHDCIILNENSGSEKLRIGDKMIDSTPDLPSILVENNIPTASMVFRNCIDGNFWKTGSEKIFKGDYLLVVLLAQFGKFTYLPRAMSVYRIHEGGIWSSKSNLFTSYQNVIFYKYLEKLFESYDLKIEIKYKLARSYYNYSKHLVISGKFRKSFSCLFQSLRYSYPSCNICVYFIAMYFLFFAAIMKRRLCPSLPSISSLLKSVTQKRYLLIL